VNILTGFTGQISLGNAAFLASRLHHRVLAGHGVRSSSPAPFGCGGCPGRHGLRRPFAAPQGLYLAMATLAAHFNRRVRRLALGSGHGGVRRISIPSPALFGFAFADDRRLFSSSFPSASLSTSPRTCFARGWEGFHRHPDQDISRR